MRQLELRRDTIHPIMMQSHSIQHNAIWCNEENMNRFYLFGSDRQQIIN